MADQTDRLRIMLEEIDEAFFALDWEYRYVHANVAGLRTAGKKTLEELLGHTPWELFPQLQGSPLEERYRQAMELGRPSVSEHRSVYSGDWLEVRIYPTPAGVTAYYREITTSTSASVPKKSCACTTRSSSNARTLQTPSTPSTACCTPPSISTRSCRARSTKVQRRSAPSGWRRGWGIRANEVVLRFTAPETFVTLFFGILDTERRVLTYCSAGHPPPVVVGERASFLPSAGAPILGAFDDVTFVEEHVRLGRHETLLLYTDGITEARDGDDRTLRRRAPVEACRGAARRAARGAAPRRLRKREGICPRRLRDDVALVAIKLTGRPHGGRTSERTLAGLVEAEAGTAVGGE